MKTGLKLATINIRTLSVLDILVQCTLQNHFLSELCAKHMGPPTFLGSLITGGIKKGLLTEEF